MRVFNVNKALGYASSGVEYAQRYRSELFAEIAWVDDRYVFTDFMPVNPWVFAHRLGFDPARVCWIYHLLAGRTLVPPAMSVDRYLSGISQAHTVSARQPDLVDVQLTGSPVSYRIRTLAGGLVDRVETVVAGRVLRIAHLDASLSTVEHLHAGSVVRRTCYTTDGEVAAEQFLHDGEILRTVVTPASPLHQSVPGPAKGRPPGFPGNLVIDGRSQFFQLVFAHLITEPDDVVIVDRALDVIDGIYPVIGKRRLFSVVHAEHYDANRLGDGVLLWNNHYEHVLTRPDLVDAYVVSTERQREVLTAQLAELGAGGTVVRIPVGHVGPSPSGRRGNTDGAAVNEPPDAFADTGMLPTARDEQEPLRARHAGPAAAPEYDPFALVTASRLADEKHLDTLIRAVAIARASIPGLSLDIFGEGKREQLTAVMRETGTEQCVRLLGHHDLSRVLSRYGLYVTASRSEGFGLSLLEALAASLPIVGFDVDYGNREMVEPGVNGVLVPRSADDSDARALAAAIVEVVGSAGLEQMRAASRARATAYASGRVRAMWETLLREEDPC